MQKRILSLLVLLFLNQSATHAMQPYFDPSSFMTPAFPIMPPPLHVIAQTKYASEAEALAAIDGCLETTGDYTLTCLQDQHGITPIHQALHTLNVFVARALLERVPHALIYGLLEAQDPNGRNILQKTFNLILIHQNSSDLASLIDIAAYILATAKIYRPEDSDASITPYVDLNDWVYGKPDEPMTTRTYFERIRHIPRCSILAPYFSDRPEGSATELVGVAARSDDDTPRPSVSATRRQLSAASKPFVTKDKDAAVVAVDERSSSTQTVDSAVSSPVVPSSPAQPAVVVISPADKDASHGDSVALASRSLKTKVQSCWATGRPRLTPDAPKPAVAPRQAPTLKQAAQACKGTSKKASTQSVTLGLASMTLTKKSRGKAAVEVTTDAAWPSDAAHAVLATDLTPVTIPAPPKVRLAEVKSSTKREVEPLAGAPAVVSAHDVFGLLKNPKKLKSWLTANKELSLKILGKKKTAQHKQSPLEFALRTGCIESTTILVKHDQTLLTWKDDRATTPSLSPFDMMLACTNPVSPLHAKRTFVVDLLTDWQLNELLSDDLVAAATTSGLIGGGARGEASTPSPSKSKKTITQVREAKVIKVALDELFQAEATKALEAAKQAQVEADRLNRQLQKQATRSGTPVVITDADGALKRLVVPGSRSTPQAILIEHIQSNTPEGLTYLIEHDEDLKTLRHHAMTIEKLNARFNYYGALLYAIEKFAWNSINYLLSKIEDINLCINRDSGITLLLAVFAEVLEFDKSSFNTSNILQLLQAFHKHHPDMNWDAQIKHGFTVLHTVIGLIKPTEENLHLELDINFIEFLLTTCKADLNLFYVTRDRVPVSAMRHAILYGHPQVIELLLRHAEAKKNTTALIEGILWLSNHLNLETYLLNRPTLEAFLANLGLEFLTQVQAYEIVRYLCTKKVIRFNSEELEKAITCVGKIARKRDLSNEVFNAKKLENFLQSLRTTVAVE